MSKSPTSEFQSSAGAVMFRVPAGSFTMGSPESEDGHRAWEQHRKVTFASDFYLGKMPVTQAQFESVAQAQIRQFMKRLRMRRLIR